MESSPAIIALPNNASPIELESAPTLPITVVESRPQEDKQDNCPAEASAEGASKEVSPEGPPGSQPEVSQEIPPKQRKKALPKKPRQRKAAGILSFHYHKLANQCANVVFLEVFAG